MICQTCKCAEATIHLKEIKENLLSEVHVCQPCFAQQTEAETMADAGTAAPQISTGSLSSPVAEEPALTCGACGMAYSAFLETGRLGCAECYQAFSTELEPFLTKIHGATRHIGKAPCEETKSLDLRMHLTELQSRLGHAITNEQYEHAASLRDQIRAFEQQTTGVSDV